MYEIIWKKLKICYYEWVVILKTINFKFKKGYTLIPKKIYFDIDGCLTSGKYKDLDLKALAKIKAFLKRKNIDAAFCTGRSQPYVELMGQILNIKGKHIIEHGCFINETKRYSDEIYPLPGIDITLLRELKGNLLIKMPNVILEPGKETISLNVSGNLTIKKLYQELDYLRDNYTVKMSADSIDIVPVGVDKGIGLTYVALKDNFSLYNVCMVGDSGGDIPALKIVGYPACPQNASEDVKTVVREKGGYIAKEKYAKGVLEILKYYF